ncbi:unnamed protein product [Cylindrotheca closterium]|uniref:Subtilisin n=1 Tax=Cylindrotheca closterium TaxID=2856 RepID=A0AAD2G760_9STRA|nr:unnamed protein product [Cylindrotheca closterium]
MQNRILLIALLALSCVSTTTGNQRKIVRLAKCFMSDGDGGTRFLAGHIASNDTDSMMTADTLTCLGNVSACFDETTVETVKTCIQDNNDTDSRFLAGHVMPDDNGAGFGMGGFRPQMGRDTRAGIAMGCLQDSSKDCIKQEVRTFIQDKLPACVRTTTTALGECYKTNAETCASTCSEADIPDSNPFAGVASTNVKACQGFQNQIMDPSCEIVDCCPQCDTEFSDLMTCVGQELLMLQPEPCELSCPSESTRRRKLSTTTSKQQQYAMRNLAGHLPTEPDASTVVDECAVYLDTEEETLSADAVAAKLLDGEFIGCVADVAILVAEEQTAFAMAQDDMGNGDGNENTTDGSSGNRVLTSSVNGLVAIVVVLGLVGLM